MAIEMMDHIQVEDDPTLPLSERVLRAVDGWWTRYRAAVPFTAVVRGLQVTDQDLSEVVIASNGTIRLVPIGGGDWGLRR